MRALVKLEQVLPSHLRRRVQAMQVGHRRPRRGGGPTVDPEALTVIATARRDRERVRFGYRGARRQREPAAGRAALAREPRPPLVPRRPGTATARPGGPSAWTGVERPRPAGSRFEPRELPAADPAAFVSAEPRRRAAAPPGAADAARPGGRAARPPPTGAGQLEPIDDAPLRVPHRRRLARVAGAAHRMLGVDFEVHEPPELVGALAELGRPDRPRYSSSTMSTSVARESTHARAGQRVGDPLVEPREGARRQAPLDVRAGA